MYLNLLAMILIIIFIYGSILILYKYTRVKDLISFLFVIYIVIMSFIVTKNQSVYFQSNFIPFKEIFRYEFLSPLFIKNVVGNILLFIPLGFFTAYKLKSKFLPLVILMFYFSVYIEIIQLIIGRVFDIDDILLNVFGGFIGYLLYKIFLCNRKVIQIF